MLSKWPIKDTHCSLDHAARCVELGSGCGLVALVCTAIGFQLSVATDQVELALPFTVTQIPTCLLAMHGIDVCRSQWYS